MTTPTPSDLARALADLARALAEVQNAAQFLSSKYVEDRIVQAVEGAVAKGFSPWLNRHTAAAHAHCSPSEIDRAADAGVFTRYHRAGTPLFRRDEIDAAIQNGKWPKRRSLVSA